MRLAYITSTLPFGGGEAFLYPEIKELLRRGLEIWVVPMYPRGSAVHPEAQEIMSRVVAEPLFSWRVLTGALGVFLCFPLRSLFALRALFTPHFHHLLKNLAVYPKGLWLGGLVREWGVDHIHAHWAATTASMAMVASAVSGVSWSLTAHRWDVVEDNLLGRKAERACFFRCISEKTREMALERGAPKEKSLVLHLGVALPRDGAPKECLRKREKYVVLCPASFIPIKGHLYLLEALKLLPAQVELWLAGEGELKKEVEKQVEQLGVKERVRFLGFLSHKELLALYQERQVDLVVLSSVDLGDGLNEGIPVSLMEAMSYGVPVVSTCTGGIPELLRDGAGVLVPEKAPKALAEAIGTLYRDRIYAQSVGEEGKRRVETEFSVEEVVERLLKLWQECA